MVVCLSFCLFVFSSLFGVCLHLHLYSMSLCLSVLLSVCFLSVGLPVCLSVYLFVCMSNSDSLIIGLWKCICNI